MYTLMKENLPVFLYAFALIWVVSACNSGSPATTPVPGNTLTVSNTPALVATGTPTSAPTPAALVPCFVTDYDPIAFMPDNNRILMRANSGVQVFNLQTMQEEKFLEAPTNLNGPAVALSLDGGTLAWALEDHSIQLIRIADQKLLHTLVGHADAVTKLKFSSRDDSLFSASHDTWIMIWDRNGEQMYAFQPTGADDFPSEVLGMGISPDGTRLASIPFDGPVKVWDLDGFKLIRELGGSGGYDTSDVTFSPDGQFVAADLATGLFLWRVSDGTELLGGNPGINSMAVAFSPDGHFLAYSDRDEIILSSPDGRQKLKTLEGHQAQVFELVFSPDGSMLASADDREIRVWQVDSGKLLYVGKSECP